MCENDQEDNSIHFSCLVHWTGGGEGEESSYDDFDFLRF
jgi:hypothetical protein